MQKPHESLDDFVVRPEEINTEPPRPVELRFTGEVEVLKPLAVWTPRAKVEPGLSWFHRSLVAGGAFALVAVILASAIFIAMYDGAIEQAEAPSEPTEVAEVPTADDPIELSADIFTTPSAETAETAEVISERSFATRKPPSAFRSRKFRRTAIRKPLILKPTIEPFVPTTLIIYIDNGEVKSRIEPQLTAGYKKIPTLSN